MHTEELFLHCMNRAFRPETQINFYRDIIRDLGGDISALEDRDATELALVIIARLGEKILGLPTTPHPLNGPAFNLLLSWYFPTDDQMLSAIHDMRGLNLESRRLTFDGMRDCHSRNMIIVATDCQDHYGTHWPQGSLLSIVRGDYRLDYLRLIGAASRVVEQDSMKDNSVLIGNTR